MKKYIMTTALALVLGTAAFSSAQAVERVVAQNAAILAGNIAVPVSNLAPMAGMYVPPQIRLLQLQAAFERLYPGTQRQVFNPQQLQYKDNAAMEAGIAKDKKFIQTELYVTHLVTGDLNYQQIRQALTKYGLTTREVRAMLADLQPMLNTTPVIGSRPDQGPDQKFLLLGLFLATVALFSAIVASAYCCGQNEDP